MLTVDDEEARERLRVLASDYEQLRNEGNRCHLQLHEARQENAKLERQLADAEHAYGSLVALFIASARLHSSLDYVDVIRAIHEIVANLIGADAFCIFFLDRRTGEVVLMKSHGCDAAALASCSELAAKTAKSGKLYVEDAASAEDGPAASIPLAVATQPMGAIVLYRMLGQKRGFSPHDYEIFDLLGKNASIALYGAKLNLLSQADRRHGLAAEVDDLMPPSVVLPRKTIRP
jgi:hypothetical protein